MDQQLAIESLQITQILPVKDFEFITENIGTLQDNWHKDQMWRTETEMRVSVLNDLRFPTPAAKYWQSVREQAGFYSSLIGTTFEYRRNKIHQEQKLIAIAECEDHLERSLLQIDLEELQFSQIRYEREAADRVREIRLWQQIMEEQVALANFDTEDVNAHQMESYARLFENRAANMGDKAGPGEQTNILGQLQTLHRVREDEKNKISYTAKVHILGD